MAQTLTLPPLGDSDLEGTITYWRKQVGDRVERDEPLVEVQAQNATATIPSPGGGVLRKILVREGERVEVGEPLAVISGMPAAEGATRPAVAAPAYVPGGEEEIVPLAPVQRLLAEHMVRSVQASPHVATIVAVDLTEAEALRRRYAERVREREGVALTFLPFVVKYAAEALARFPALNAQLVGETIRRKKYVHVAVAVPGEGGTTAPVVRDADKKGLVTIARELADFEARARAGALQQGEVRGATFSITNPGASGALLQTPILHQPQAAILSVGTVVKTPVVVEDRVAVRLLTHLCLSHDARLVDGDTAALFLQDIQRSLEEIRFLFV